MYGLREWDVDSAAGRDAASGCAPGDASQAAAQHQPARAEGPAARPELPATAEGPAAHAEEAPAAEGAAADPERAPREPGTWLGAAYEALSRGQPGHWRTSDELGRCAASRMSPHSAVLWCAACLARQPMC